MASLWGNLPLQAVVLAGEGQAGATPRTLLGDVSPGQAQSGEKAKPPGLGAVESWLLQL